MIFFSKSNQYPLSSGALSWMASISDSPYKNIKMRPPTDSKTTKWKRKLRSLLQSMDLILYSNSQVKNLHGGLLKLQNINGICYFQQNKTKKKIFLPTVPQGGIHTVSKHRINYWWQYFSRNMKSWNRTEKQCSNWKLFLKLSDWEGYWGNVTKVISCLLTLWTETVS